jgi:glycosyltransferase involved in cell wall biosynthesis
MALNDITPVLITRDAGSTLERSLASLREFPEVIVYDNGSTDNTYQICARHCNVRVISGEFYGFGKTKAHANSFAKCDWILSIDADEYLGPELLDSLQQVPLKDRPVAYSLRRRNLLLNKHIERAGWGNNWLVRLFDRRDCQFNDAVVHEKVSVPPGTRVTRLSGALWHQAVNDIDEFLKKIGLYSELEIYRSKRVHKPFVICLHAAWAFLPGYFINAGFREGWRGLLIASCDATGCFFKHMKRYVHREQSTPDLRLALPSGPATEGNGDMIIEPNKVLNRTNGIIGL